MHKKEEERQRLEDEVQALAVKAIGVLASQGLTGFVYEGDHESSNPILKNGEIRAVYDRFGHRISRFYRVEETRVPLISAEEAKKLLYPDVTGGQGPNDGV